MSIEQNSESFKKEIKSALDESFGPLLVQIAKMIKEMSDTVKNQKSSNDLLISKLDRMYFLQTEMQSKIANLANLPEQFEKLDKNLSKFLQKSIQDAKKIQEQIEEISKEAQTHVVPIQEETTKTESLVEEPMQTYQNTRDLMTTMDTEYLKDLLAEFSKKEIYTTEALRIIERTRDKLLFERDDEVPYRAFAAKIFREILAIVKQEKDFRTISPLAAQDIKKHIANLLEHI